jgi:hypothetical protein
MPRSKPTAVTVIAILQLIFGGLGLCIALANLAGLPQQMAALNQQNVQKLPPAQRPPTQAELEEKVEKHLPSYQAIQKGSLAGSAVLCVLMLLSGIGLLAMRPWGRFVAITYAVLSILYTVASLVFTAAVVMPAMSEAIQDLAGQGNAQAQLMAQAMQIGMVAGLAIGALVVIYPIIVLVIMLLPSVRAAFRGETLPAEPEDYRDAGPPGEYRDTDETFRTGEE